MVIHRQATNPRLSAEHTGYGTPKQQPGPGHAHKPEEAQVERYWIRQYFAIFFVFLVLSFQEQIIGNLMPYITSSFGHHGLLSTVSVASSTISAVSKLPVATTVEACGDYSTYLGLVFLCVTGMMVVPFSANIWVFSLVKVLYSVGDNSITYLIDIALIRGSSLQQRSCFLALAASPCLIATFVAPPIAERFLGQSSYVWGFMALVGVTLISCVSMSSLIFRPRGTLLEPRASARRNNTSSFITKFIGIVLFTLSLLITLLPLSFLGSLSHGQMLLHLAAGSASWLSFCALEYQSTSDCFFPTYLLRSRTVLLSSFTGFGLWMSFFEADRISFHDIYFSSYLQVAYGLEISSAGYIGGLYNVMSCIGALVSGFYALRYGRIKRLAVIAVQLHALSILLMSGFVRRDGAILCLTAGQALNGLSGGILMYSGQTIAMAAAKKAPAKPHHHDDGVRDTEADPESNHATTSEADEIVSLALVNLFDSTGSSIGQSLAGFLYSSLMPQLLREYLPGHARDQWRFIYSSIKVQLHWPIGSRIRESVIHAFVDTWWYLCAVSFAITLFLIPCVLCWEDIDLAELDKSRDECR
ncbi:major facilitator superfamily domain-containing protein [Aspergillus fruticulosus]